ncbi:MAG: matrixin family metalloprotease [Patescibacteria group bacterium]
MQKSSSLPFLLSVLIGLAAFLGYTVYTADIPCVTPITYSLATVDERFNLSTKEVETNLKVAAAVWNEAVGKEVLKAGEKATLPVSFVYDKTQKTVDTLSSLEEEIDTAKAELTKIANEYAALKATYDAANSKGRATQQMYDDLQTLYGRYETLRKKINTDVARGRALPTGEIEEGKYIRDQEGTRIYIYAYQDKTELKRTLIHEFGHALGLGHVENENSIMYPSNNTSQSLSLSKEDKAELSKVCDAAEQSFLAKIYIATEPVMNFLSPYIVKLQALAK